MVLPHSVPDFNLKSKQENSLNFTAALLHLRVITPISDLITFSASYEKDIFHNETT